MTTKRKLETEIPQLARLAYAWTIDIFFRLLLLHFMRKRSRPITGGALSAVCAHFSYLGVWPYERPIL